MATFRSSNLRHTTRNATLFLRTTQRRWAQVHDVRFLVTHQRSESVAEKYMAKLQQKAKREGLKDVNELKAIYQDKIEAQKKMALTFEPRSTTAVSSAFPPPPPPPAVEQTPSPQIHAPTSSAANQSNSSGIKTLSSYIDIAKILQLPQKEIEFIWRLRHASNPQSLCAVIPKSAYQRIGSTARRHPQFVLPLPREGKGAEIHFLQWAFPSPTTSTVLFTHLAEFKLRGEYAQPHTTVTHHLDISDEKGLVLLQGSVVEGRGITVDEGKWLLMCLQKFYGGEEAQTRERRKLLEQFSQGNGGFKVEELLEEAEKIV